VLIQTVTALRRNACCCFLELRMPKVSVPPRGFKPYLVVTFVLLVAVLLFGVFQGAAMATPEPKHTVVVADGSFQLRDYDPVVVAEVVVAGDQERAANAGFRLLADYIFGGNVSRAEIAMTAPVTQARRQGEKIAMTAPVTQTQDGEMWTVQFVMPADYTMETLPVPNDARVKLVQWPAKRFAVIRFGGLAPPAEVARRTEELKALVAVRRLEQIGAPTLSRYDAPWTPWFMRRNEIWIRVANPADQ
jgi:hypothetical protein